MRRFQDSVMWRKLLFVLLLSCLVSGAIDPGAEDEEKVLHIGGIFPINGTSGWQGGQACQPAAMLALQDVNERADLLKGYKLNLVWNDSLCDPGLGAAVMYELLYNAPTKLMLLGGCSTVSTTIGEAARMWNLIVVSFGSSSPALSDRKRFPTFFRTHPSATVHNPTRVKLMKKFGWTRIAILQQAEEVFISTAEDLEIEATMNGVEILTRQSFLNDPTDAVKNLKRHDARIIVGLFYVVAARRVLCEIYKNNLYGKGKVWFFIGWYENGWYERHLKEEELNCTLDQMRNAAEGHLTTEAIMWNRDNKITISNTTAEAFRKRLEKELFNRGYEGILDDIFPEGYQEAPLAYDAIWSMALALNVTMEKLAQQGKSLRDFTYSNSDIADQIYEAMNATQFLGVSGPVAFKTDGSRVAWTQVEQLIRGKYEVLGYYDGQTDNLTWFEVERWEGGKVPQDRTIIKSELRTISLGLFIAMSCISAFGILVSLFLLLFSCLYSHRRMMRMSHPACNNVTLGGSILCFSSVFLLGLDGRFIPEENFAYLCTARAWILSFGFSLAYGSLFSKIWRVHRLSTKSKVESKQISVDPWKIYAMVGAMLVVDVVVLSVWQGVDPMVRTLETFPLEIPLDTDDDVKIMPQLEHCESTHNNIWLGTLFSIKGLLLILGLFLSYETRSVKLDKINDSRLVGMSIYNVAVLCIITAPVTLLVSSQQDASFAFAALSIIFCCFLSMALIFVPKIVEVVQNPRERVDSTEHGPSREEEERYHALVAENEDMQKLISEKEEMIKLLKEKIAQRNAAKAREAASLNHVVAAPESQTRLRQAGTT
ncbi:gamma-aminobutyric acid type B receptor subunit 1 isoform X2 [Hyalella azteca]|uniref:Gamma-aminobutyric acid type B receptor subunit 1 isoform X2 n=1 Tax=Hyalella azteca TaxID=294128 RepID=A0A979FIM1_HYAAZ|nr:gamma-aminobutyric acid type B receptor subunit 1 isoform X2 [Hyalella azteca]